MELIKIVKGPADIMGVIAGGIVEYRITDTDGHTYQLFIDMTDKNDVGSTATFMPHYDKSITLMRWIRRAMDNGSLLQLD